MKTDAEFIARLRKNQRLKRILRWLYPPLALCLVAGLGSLVYETRTVVVMQESSGVPVAQAHAQGMIAGIFIASLCWFGILWLILCARYWVLGSWGTRTQRMLMKYYDMAIAGDPPHDCNDQPTPQPDEALPRTQGEEQ
jgi:hypothetical protein